MIETMSGKILQMNFTFNMSERDYERALSPLAGDIAAIPGLRWKVWLMNELEGEAGGIYLFDSKSSLDNFLAGDLASQVTSHPAFSDMTARPYEVLDGPSRTTRAPL